jgi:chromosome segregation ATPase
MQADLQHAQAAHDEALGELIGLRLRVDRSEKEAIEGRAAQRNLEDAQRRAAAAEEAVEALQEEVETLARRADEAEALLDAAKHAARSRGPSAEPRDGPDPEEAIAAATQKYEAVQAQLEASEAAAAVAGAERDELAEHLAASEAALLEAQAEAAAAAAERDDLAGQLERLRQVETELVSVQQERDSLTGQLESLRRGEVAERSTEITALLPESRPAGAWLGNGASSMPVSRRSQGPPPSVGLSGNVLAGW